VYVERLPIVIAKDQKPVIKLVDALLKNCQKRFDDTKQFVDYITSIHAPKSISEKLWEFFTLEFRDFIDELKKQRVKMTPSQEMGLMPLFEEKRNEIQTLTKIINDLDDEVDRVVYALYGLSPDEIATVESRCQ
jgi:DNA polymerase III delta prime subunit